MIKILLPGFLFYAVGCLAFVGGPLLRRTWRENANWRSIDTFGLTLPFLLWSALAVALPSDMSLSNLVAEPIYVVFGLGLASSIRIALGKHVNERLLRVSFFVLAGLVAFLVFYATPALPE